METLKEKVAYVKGLCDGLEITHETKEGKILLAIVDILDDMAIEVEEAYEAYTELDTYVESIDEAVMDIEEVIFDEDDYEDDFEDDYVDVECPNCGDKVFIDEQMFEEEEDIVCPNCNESITFETSCGGCDCSCEDCGE